MRRSGSVTHTMHRWLRSRARLASCLAAAAVAVLWAAAGEPLAQPAPLDALRPMASHAPAPAAIPPVSFTTQVIPVLTKMGCNSGPCHGAEAGKNGFALTLRGYDPAADYDAIARQAGGRRVNPMEPARSLLLLKPTESVPHMGGKRFEPGSMPYTVLANWIAAGMPPPSAHDPSLVRLEVTPGDATLAVGDTRRLGVTARFSDGAVRDVTALARFASADETVASVDDSGVVRIVGPGETAVSVSFLTGVALTRVRAPFPNDVAAGVYDRSPRRNLIDDHVLAKLRELRIPPSGQADDHAFIRRAFLDAAGMLPTRAEVEAFLTDTSPDRRAALVDRLLARDEFVDYWTYRWSDLLLVSSRSLGPANVRAFYGWIRGHVAANTPWDRFVYELATATGRTTDNGATNYYLIHRNPTDIAENFTQAFLGLTLTCARCHNHPMEKWTQNDYYGFANLFARVSMKEEADGGGKGDTATILSAAAGDVFHPRTGVAMPPRPLDGAAMAPGSREDRRAYLATWLTSPDNRQFARTLVNRVWGAFFGRGLVHPVDDLRETNPASNEPLLEALTTHIIENGYDVRGLIRLIMTSAAYQRSSEPRPGNEADDRFFARYLTRRLPAEVMLDAFSQVTGVPETFEGYPPGTRALELPDTRVSSYFLDVFGRPARVITSAAERMQDPTLPQALHTINGETLNRKLMADEGIIARLVAGGRSNAEVIDELYWTALSRPPTAAERERLLAVLAPDTAEPAERRRSLEDLGWAVLTSTEFLFNH